VWLAEGGAGQVQRARVRQDEGDERAPGWWGWGAPPAQPDANAERQQVRHGPRLVGRVAGKAAVEVDVGLGDRDGRAHDDVADAGVLEVGMGGDGGHAGRRSTISSVSPSCTTSSRWSSTVASTTS